MNTARSQTRSRGALFANLRKAIQPEPDPRDAAYRERYAEETISGFKVLSAVVFAAISAMFLAHLVQRYVHPASPADELSTAACAAVALASGGGLLASRSIRSPGAAIAATSCLLVACVAVLTCDSLQQPAGIATAARPMMTLVFSILMLSSAVLPLRPSGALRLGALLLVTFGLAAHFCGAPLRLSVFDWVGAGIVVTVTVAVAARSTTVRIRMHQAFASAIEAERQTELARQRALLAENAVTMERLAAALSHELNTPVGVLKSASETLARGVRKYASFPSGSPVQQIIQDLADSIQTSTTRVCETVARIQRFANLDRSGVRLVDVNQLVRDAVALMDPLSIDQPSLRLNLRQVPRIWCRPQAVSAAIASILETALANWTAATVETYSDGRRIAIVLTTPSDSTQSRTDADLGFSVIEGRVRSSGWDVFTARQLVREQGGELRVDRSPNRGELVSITLPVDAAFAVQPSRKAAGAA